MISKFNAGTGLREEMRCCLGRRTEERCQERDDEAQESGFGADESFLGRVRNSPRSEE